MAETTTRHMPGRTHHSAPKFDGTPTLLANFFEEIDQLAEACNIKDKEKIEWTLRYAPIDDVELWKMSKHAKSDKWTEFKDDIYTLYPGSTGDRKYSVANLEMFTEQQAGSPMETSLQFGKYYRSFCKIAHFLKSKDRLTEREISAQFMQGFDLAFRNKVRAQLRAENPTHHTDDPYKLEQICSAALLILSCNHGDSIREPEVAEPAVSVKCEQFDISDMMKQIASANSNFNMTILAQEIAKMINVPQSSSVPTQNLNQGNTAQITSNQYNRPDRPRYNNCIFCSDPTHYMNSCPHAMEYVQKGRCKRNAEGQMLLPNGEGQMLLPNGDRVSPRVHFGRNLMERIDNWHKDNGHGNTVSTNFIGVSEPDPEELIPEQSQFVWIEVEDEQDASEPTVEELEDLQLMESLIISTQKKVDETRKKFDAHKTAGPTTRSAARKETAAKAQTTKSASATQEPRMAAALPTDPRQLKAAAVTPTRMPNNAAVVPTSSNTSNGPQFKYFTPIESAAIVEQVTQNALNVPVTLSMREILAIAPEVRKQVKEQITMKRLVPTGALADTKLPVMKSQQLQVGVVQTFMAGLPTHTDEIIVANHSEKLRAIDVILDGKLTVEAIMDEGSQIIGLHKDIWEKLTIAIRRDHQMTMETANKSLEMSIGLLQDLKLSINGYDFYIQAQVVENAPYDLLLGLPFHVLAQANTQFFKDGTSHLTLTDPNTEAVIMIPTKERSSRKTNQVKSTVY